MVQKSSGVNGPLVLVMLLLLAGFVTFFMDAQIGLQIIIASFLGLFLVVAAGAKGLAILLPIDILLSAIVSVILAKQENSIIAYLMSTDFLSLVFLNIVVFMMVFGYAVASSSRAESKAITKEITGKKR